MKSVLFITNHIKWSDGVCRSLINFTNSFDKEEYDIYVVSLFQYNLETVKQFNLNVKTYTLFGYYFRGLSKLLSLLPKNLLYKYILEKIVKKKNIDYLISYQAGIPTDIVGEAKTSDHTKKICWIHGIDKELSQKDSFRKMDCIINVSDEGKSLIDINFPYIKSFQLNNIVNISKPRVMTYFNNDYFTILGLGRLSPEKGFERLIKIVSDLILIEDYKINLIIVGDGILYDKLYQQIENLGLHSRIKLVGEQKNVSDYYGNVDLYVCSSYSEGLSTSTIESIIVGTPVISTMVPGAKQIIEKDKCGFVVDNNNAALKQGIKRIYENKIELNFFKENCKKCGDEFSPKYIQKRFSDILKQLD